MGAFDKLINKAQNFIGKQLGLNQTVAQSPSSGGPKLPWDQNDVNNKDEVFWRIQEIDGQRWDKLYPYRLIVIDVTKNNQIVGNSSGGKVNTKTSKSATPNGGIEYVLTQEIINGSWEFTLPITPQMLRVSDQYAINTTATMRGIVEEHNGVKFKMIQAQGTTGIWASRPTTGGVLGSPTALGSILAGTLEKASSLFGSLKKVATAFTGKNPASASVSDAKRPEETSFGIYSTGYYQALLMGQFLERYAQAKKNPANKNWRLVFDIPKENQAFIVTPVAFSLEKSQQRPMEYIWNIQLKAWKRIPLVNQVPSAAQELPKLNVNMFQRITNTIGATRSAISNSVNLVKAVRSDWQNVLNVFRQTSLVIKDVGGLAVSVVDLPSQMIGDLSSTVKESLANIKSAFKGGSTGSFTDKSDDQMTKAAFAMKSISDQSKSNEGLSHSAINNGALGLGSAQSLEINPTQQIFSNSEEYFELFDAVKVDDLALSREQQEAIDLEIEKARLITIDDLTGFRSIMQGLAIDIADYFGAGDQTYSDIYKKPDPKTRVFPMTIEENEILVSLWESIQAMDLLLSTTQFDDFNIPSPLAYVGGLAAESGIDFDQAQSKILVPVPFGLTIEQIALRYLGDPDKYIEIATLNKLVSPYIDEVGFTLDLLSNGDGRQINVDNSENKLYMGQKVILKSNTTQPFTRKIIDISKISDNNYLISLDGLADLDSLTTANDAYVQGYLPGTVNSQNQIYIPTNAPAQPDDRVRIPSHLDEDVLTRISKIDWLLTDEGDIAINQLGDFRLANGLTNLVQALKLKIRTKKNSLLRHPEFGLGLKHGMSYADIEAGDLINEMNRMIQDDPRFSGIDRIDIRINGPTISIDMAVKIASGSGVVPITFTV
jgi:hypothetical protein